MENVKLPKEAGEELDRYKDRYDFDDLARTAMHGSIDNPLRKYWSHNGSNALLTLADAWRYGWEPLSEPEKKYYVYVPKTKRQAKYAILQDRVVVYDLSMREICKELTEKQINHFSLDEYEREEVTDD